MIASADINGFINAVMQSDLRWVIYIIGGIIAIPIIIQLCIILFRIFGIIISGVLAFVFFIVERVQEIRDKKRGGGSLSI